MGSFGVRGEGFLGVFEGPKYLPCGGMLVGKVLNLGFLSVVFGFKGHSYL